MTYCHYADVSATQYISHVWSNVACRVLSMQLSVAPDTLGNLVHPFVPMNMVLMPPF
jgi:hypothetical protein